MWYNFYDKENAEENEIEKFLNFLYFSKSSEEWYRVKERLRTMGSSAGRMKILQREINNIESVMN